VYDFLDLTESDFDFIFNNVPEKYRDVCVNAAVPIWRIVTAAPRPMRGEALEFFMNVIPSEVIPRLNEYYFAFSFYMVSRAMSIAAGTDELARRFLQVFVELVQMRGELFSDFGFVKAAFLGFEETELKFSSGMKVRNILSSLDKERIGDLLSAIYINTISGGRSVEMGACPVLSIYFESLYSDIRDAVRPAVDQRGQVPRGAASRAIAATKKSASETQPLVLSQGEDKQKQKHPNIWTRYLAALALLFLIFLFFSLYRSTRLDVVAAEESMKAAIIENLRDRIPERHEVSEIAKKVLPSTVTIYVEDKYGGVGHGSGFFVNDAGDILTDFHVVDDASEITIKTNEGKTYSARIRAFDEKKDLALLSSETPRAESLPLPITAELPEQGTEIVAVGAPLDFRQSVVSGVVSASRDEDQVTYIQFTAPISHGSSGGPIVNMDGAVVGITESSIEEGQNINFAVPSIYFKPFIEYARDKPPMKLAERETTPSEDPNEDDLRLRAGESLMFVSSDPNYKIYLYKDSIEYDEDDDSLTYVWTRWIPSEAQKAKVAGAMKLTEKPLDYFELNYAIDIEDASGAHVRTINYYEDGSVARDYTEPKLKWETMEEDERVASILSALGRMDEHTDADELARAEDGSWIPTPDERGFMGHAWGSGLAELKKRLPGLESLGNLSGVSGVEYFSTQRQFRVFDEKADAMVVYEFFKDKLAKIIFIIYTAIPKVTMNEIINDLNRDFGNNTLDAEGGRPVYLWSYRDFGIYARDPLGVSPAKTIEFFYYPLIEQYP
jgi:hypothetical protein